MNDSLGRHVPPRVPGRSTRSPVAALAALSAGVIVGVLFVADWGADPPHAPPSPPPAQAVATAAPQLPPPGTSRWRKVLEGLTDSRAEAWRRTRPGGLRDAFVVGSRSWSLDRRRMREYAARGLHVEGAHMRLASVAPVAVHPGSVRLEVVDRLARSVALGPSGVRHPLPRDEASRHAVILARTVSGWRIASVRPWRTRP